MVSQQTPSAAEAFALWLKARDNTYFLGENSAGAFTDALTKTLPNEWGITLSNETYLDAIGRHYEFTGLPVQRHFAFPNIDAWPKKRDPALEEAITLLSSKTPN